MDLDVIISKQKLKLRDGNGGWVRVKGIEAVTRRYPEVTAC